MSPALRPGTWLGNYELLLGIGRGGMATVWVARERAADPTNDRLVAIKAMLADLSAEPEFVKMFLDEVRLVRAIRHPNVVDVYDVGEHDGIMYMAMEWVEGDSLHTVITEAGKRRPIPPEMAVRIIADAAAGLHAAHELRDEHGRLRGVVHRDVSPHNILLGTNGVIKLVDFGVAKAVGRLSEVTRSGQVKGKFGYMAPEQLKAVQVDRRADVFALGIVLFELTTNRRLFRGETDVDTLRLALGGRVPRPSTIVSDYPRRLEGIVMRALERDLSRRYQSAEELRIDLEAYLKAERIVVPHTGLAGLLKRVMGPRIEQRRKAVRQVIKALDWGAELHTALAASADVEASRQTSAAFSSFQTGSGGAGAPPSASGARVSIDLEPPARSGVSSGVPIDASGTGPAVPSRYRTAIGLLLGLIVALLVVVILLVLDRGP